MGFHKIEPESWARRELYQHYFSAVPCTYSMTVNLNITKLRALGLKLYPTMLYLLAATVNSHEEFRMATDADGSPGVFDCVHPCYTVFHEQSQLFSNLWTEFDTDYRVFRDRYDRDLALYGAVERMNAKPDAPENTFPVSMLPWAAFTGFHLNLQKGYDYLPPIFTIGKFFSVGGDTLLPLALQVHHAVCDGFHVSRFIAELQDRLDQLAPPQL